MVYGVDLVKRLEDDIRLMQESADRRAEHIANCDFDWDDCFVSERVDTRGIRCAQNKIALINDGGCAWFREYATLDGTLVNAHWCHTKFGTSLRAEMPDGTVVWTSSCTANGLAKRGLKAVECLRPAWYAFRSSVGGMAGVYCGDYELFPSDVNYATGETASKEPIAIREV